MNISITHRITCLTMAFLMFFTSVGFSADVHFCKGDFKSFSLIGEASSCHNAKKSCPHHAKTVIEDNSVKECCSNQTFKVDDIDVDYNVTTEVKLIDIQIQFVVSFVCSYHSIFPPCVSNSPFLDIKDLLPSMDIYVLLERFLI